MPRRLVATDPAHEQLIDLLVGARLVTSDDGVVEIAHEALARAWPRLRGWLDDDVEGQRILHHLTAAADAWDTMGRPDSELYRGVRLAQALEWRADRRRAHRHRGAFLAASRSAPRAEQRAPPNAAATQARMIRRLRGVLAGAVVLLVAALVAGGLAVRQSEPGRAERNAAAALADETAAEARRVGARALATDDIDSRCCWRWPGVRLDDSPETRSSLLAALARHPELIASTQMAGSRVICFDVSPDGRPSPRTTRRTTCGSTTSAPGG